jgi:3-deoxy-manno-octulosonate cytidylyltransferase (CMP-KDO synthetase)
MSEKRGKTAAVIPARFGSTRFPGKVLADLHGKPLVQWVYERAAASGADEVLVATDDERVRRAVEAFGGTAVMTSPDHPSGTDRIHEALARAGSSAEVVVNVQGDEPMLPPTVIDQLLAWFRDDPGLAMATVAVPADRALVAANPNIVKVAIDADGNALYFSRAPIPFLREGGEAAPMYRHWGIYAYRREALARLVRLPESPLERCEKLEQLRALEAGIRIRVLISDLESLGVDTPEDLEIVRKRLPGQAKTAMTK